MEKAKNPVTGGVYWIDFKEFRLPEWGNSPKGKPHLAVIYKINNFNKKEMFLALPITTRNNYLFTYGNKVVHRLYEIDYKDKKHYVLLNHARTIAKGRILDQFIINQKKVVLSNKSLKSLRKAYLSYYDFYLSKPFIKE